MINLLKLKGLDFFFRRVFSKSMNILSFNISLYFFKFLEKLYLLEYLFMKISKIIKKHIRDF